MASLYRMHRQSRPWTRVVALVMERVKMSVHKCANILEVVDDRERLHELADEVEHKFRCMAIAVGGTTALELTPSRSPSFRSNHCKQDRQNRANQPGEDRESD